MSYRIDFACDDRDPLQQELNALYDYRDDWPTKVQHRARLNLFHLLLEDLGRRGLIGRRGAALDVGCNAGYYSKMLSDTGYAAVHGVDIEPGLVKRAERAFGSNAPGHTLTFEVADAERLDTSRRYDFVLCTEVIEHTSQPGRVIANLAEVVAPGGILVVSLPNACSPPFQLARLIAAVRRKPKDPVFEDHLRWPFWRILGLFRDTGLERVRATGVNLVLDDHVLSWAYGKPFFPALSRLNFELSRRAPLCYVSQFFFMAYKRRDG
jgi:2-polyprenyl-3-methyl-5-hydroxy-6-metoxy-1,4-benzoquinol methylase